MNNCPQEDEQHSSFLFNEDEGETIDPGNDPLTASGLPPFSSQRSMHSMIPESESSSSSSMVFSSDEEYEDVQRGDHSLHGSLQSAGNSNANTANACDAEEGGIANKSSASNLDGSCVQPASSETRNSSPMNAELQLWDVNSVFLRILSYCMVSDVCALMGVNRQFYALSTDDVYWKEFISRFNLQPLLSFPTSPRSNYYRYFVDEIITTRALHGHYFFEAANSSTLSDSAGKPISESGGKSVKNGSPVHSSQQEFIPQQQPDALIFPVETITLLLSSATLGHMRHSIGRVQLFVVYKDKANEMMQGAARFCLHRGCFMFSCASFGSNLRGPVFTVALNTVHKKWANQSHQQFLRHIDGIQLIMTPALLEGHAQGSRITERDIITVSRPPIVESR